MQTESMHFTGTQINYYFICKKKLWYFTHAIHMEQNSDLVYLGKLIHENSYQRENKEIEIDNTIKIDFIDKDKIIHEVKKTDKMEDSHIWQLKYYIWYLKQKGVEGVTGKINYPKLKKIVDVLLETEDNEKINTILTEIKSITNAELPAQGNKTKICRSCSYGDLCWV